MAERRMFAKTIIDSDAFLDMPQSSQLLYFHLAMRADDDGFVNKPKSIMRIAGAKDDDMKLLCAKKFLIPFQSGVCVIKHWRIHNYIQRDRYTETKYLDEKNTLTLDENKAYRSLDEACIQSVHTMDTQVRLGKVRLDIDDEDDIPRARELERDVEQSYRQSFGKPPTNAEVDYICRVADGYGEAALAGEAVKRAALFGATSVATYVLKILDEWRLNKVFTEDELAEYDYLNDVTKGNVGGMTYDEAVQKLRERREK